MAESKKINGLTVSTVAGSLTVDQTLANAAVATGGMVVKYDIVAGGTTPGPYNPDGSLKSDDEIDADISAIINGGGSSKTLPGGGSFTPPHLLPMLSVNAFNGKGAMYGAYAAVGRPISLIGKRPMVRISITGKNGEKIADLGGGHITVGIPYTLQPNEDSSRIIGLTVDEKGKETIVTNSTYNEQDKMLYISGTNLDCIYAVGYRSDAPKFNDIASHWAKNDIEFVTARGLLAGTGNNVFAPDAAVTKGDFVAALTKIAGKDMSGLVKGDKNQPMTRQEMAEIMVQFAKSTGYKLTKNRAEMKFSDTENEAVKTMQMAGVIMAKNG
ncbi:MAG: S-layer homology domain-containing protein, partial [Oscillospiraceae bacterium]